MKRMMKLTITGLAAAMLLMVGCTPTEGVPEDQDLKIMGKVVDAQGNGLAEVEVSWLTDDSSPMDFLGSAAFSSNNYNEIGESADRRYEYVLTDADGNFEFSFTGKDANTKDSAGKTEKVAAYHHILVNASATGDTETMAVILSVDHQFTPDSGYTWDVGNVTLWEAPSVSLDDESFADRAFVDFAWGSVESAEWYYFEVVNSRNEIVWEYPAASTESTASLPVEAIHPAYAYGAEAVFLSRTPTWYYRSESKPIPNLDSTIRRDNLLDEDNNDEWYMQDGDNVVLAPADAELCGNTMNDDNIIEGCDLLEEKGGFEEDLTELYIDFDDVNVKGDGNTENITTIIMWNTEINNWSNAQLYVDVWDEASAGPEYNHGWDEFARNDYNRVATMYAVDDIFLFADTYIVIELAEPVTTRHMRFKVESTDGSAAYFEEIGEFAIF